MHFMFSTWNDLISGLIQSMFGYCVTIYEQQSVVEPFIGATFVFHTSALP